MFSIKIIISQKKKIINYLIYKKVLIYFIMQRKTNSFTLLFFTIILFESIIAREYCIQSTWIDVWCEDSYNCCSNSVGYWLCFKKKIVFNLQNKGAAGK